MSVPFVSRSKPNRLLSDYYVGAYDRVTASMPRTSFRRR